MKAFRSIAISLAVFVSFFVSAQDIPKKLDFNGYLSGMPQYYWADTIKYKQALLHNRLNFTLYPSTNLIVSAEFRNQLLYGDFVEMGNFENGFVTENYFLPLTFQQTFNTKGLLSIAADRFWAQYTKNKLEIKLGRQRINWGQTFVWNPNDIFNTYNFFDFDYAERPGADAVRIQYYTGMASQIDLAAKIDSGNNITAAALYRINKWNYDFQFLGGYYSQPHQSNSSGEETESDWVCGFGFTGDYRGVSLRTEASYLYPTIDNPNPDDLFLISIGVDYTFSNSLNTSAEILYASDINLPTGSDFFSLYSGPMTIKTMAYTKYTVFVQTAYPVTPLLNATISGMIFTDKRMDGFYVGPSISYSVLQNLEFSGFFQFFRFWVSSPITGERINSNSNLAFLRLKWNF